ncbi:hypothetical protein MPTK1_7g17620 [Marchantia polymorpha subsp. ruderalis]|nr:hypothetical protein Mapa_008983 [Marchantia paleacea]
MYTAMADDVYTILVTGAVLAAITILFFLSYKVFKILKTRYRARRQMQCQTSPRPPSQIQVLDMNGTSPGNVSPFNPVTMSTNV